MVPFAEAYVDFVWPMEGEHRRASQFKSSNFVPTPDAGVQVFRHFQLGKTNPEGPSSHGPVG